MKKWMQAACILTAVALTACTPTTDFPTEAEEETETLRTVEVVDMDMVFIFRYKDGNFERVTLDVEKMTDQLLMDKLIEYGVLEEGTEILSFTIEGGEIPEDATVPEGVVVGPGGVAGVTATPKIGTLDLSKIPAWPADVEEMMLKCLGNTFVDNYQLDELKLLVNGENYSGATITLGDDDYLGYESGAKNASE